MTVVAPRDAGELLELLRARASEDGLRWLEDAMDRIRRDPASLATVFPAVGRKVGRQPLRPDDGRHCEHDWTVDDAGRVLLLGAAGDQAWDEIDDLYRFGDTTERRAVLRALPLLPRLAEDGHRPGHGAHDVGLDLVDDAVRTNDPRLIAAALNPYAVARMEEDAFNQAVLKCVFVGVPLTAVEGVTDRANPALARMLAAYAWERVAAGRDVPPDLWPLVDAFPPQEELAAIEAELAHPVAERRTAAAAALAQRKE